MTPALVWTHVFRRCDTATSRLLWIGQSASVIGDALVVVALALYVTRTTGRPTDVAIVLLAYSLPLVLFVLIGGVIADWLPAAPGS